jgi:hypothetical protein
MIRYGITVGASKETTVLNAGPALAVSASASAGSENVGGTASGSADSFVQPTCPESEYSAPLLWHSIVLCEQRSVIVAFNSIQ